MADDIQDVSEAELADAKDFARRSGGIFLQELRLGTREDIVKSVPSISEAEFAAKLQAQGVTLSEDEIKALEAGTKLIELAWVPAIAAALDLKADSGDIQNLERAIERRDITDDKLREEITFRHKLESDSVISGAGTNLFNLLAGGLSSPPSRVQPPTETQGAIIKRLRGEKTLDELGTETEIPVDDLVAYEKDRKVMSKNHRMAVLLRTDAEWQDVVKLNHAGKALGKKLEPGERSL